MTHFKLLGWTEISTGKVLSLHVANACLISSIPYVSLIPTAGFILYVEPYVGPWYGPETIQKIVFHCFCVRRGNEASPMEKLHI